MIDIKDYVDGRPVFPDTHRLLGRVQDYALRVSPTGYIHMGPWVYTLKDARIYLPLKLPPKFIAKVKRRLEWEHCERSFGEQAQDRQEGHPEEARSMFENMQTILEIQAKRNAQQAEQEKKMQTNKPTRWSVIKVAEAWQNVFWNTLEEKRQLTRDLNPAESPESLSFSSLEDCKDLREALKEVTEEMVESGAWSPGPRREPYSFKEFCKGRVALDENGNRVHFVGINPNAKNGRVVAVQPENSQTVRSVTEAGTASLTGSARIRLTHME